MLVYAICADLIWNSKQILKSRTKFILAADEPLHDKRVGGRWWPDYGWYGIICPPIMGWMALCATGVPCGSILDSPKKTLPGLDYRV